MNIDNDHVIDGAEIGRGTYWHSSTRFVSFDPNQKITVGRYCSIAGGGTIMGGGNHRLDAVSTYPFDTFLLSREGLPRSYGPTQPTTIGSDVWIGHGVIILGGAQIGHGAVLGAGAVVRGVVEPYAVAIGNPARVVGQRFTAPIQAALLSIAWWDWSPQEIRDRADWFYEPVEAFVAEFGTSQTKASSTLATLEIAEINHREEALRAVADAAVAAARWWGFDKKRFKALVVEEGRRTSTEGAAAVRHAVLHDEVCRVLSSVTQKKRIKTRIGG